jgi:ABC-2 type transport system permease protein
MLKFARDVWLVFQRHMTLLIRSPVWIAVGLAQPVVYLTLFAPLLRNALATPSGPASYARAYLVYVPGLLIAIAGFGGLFSGLGILAELRAGIIERIRVTPVNRTALLLGRALREVANMIIQGLVITVLAVPLGLRASLADVLLGYLIFALAGLMATSLSYGVGLLIRNEAALGPVINAVAQPLMLLGGVLLPLTLAPLWLQRIAYWNPFYWATVAMRALFAGHLADPAVWRGLVIVGGMTAVTVAWSSRLFARSLR